MPIPVPITCGALSRKPPHRITRLVNQVLGEIARLDLLRELLLVGRIQNVVQISQQRTKR